MKVGFFGRYLKEEDISPISILIESLYSAGIDILFYKPFLESCENSLCLKGLKYSTFTEEDNLDIDLLLALGGDGTFLNVLSVIKLKNIPVLGINLGNLGFLTSVGKEEIKTLTQNILKKKYTIDERSLILLNSPHQINESNVALNEFSIHRKDDFSLLGVSLFVNDEFVADYFGDGLIVATPTGSTAYSLSCGGPVLTPDSQCFVITPIAAHTLTLRPIVIPDQSKIKLVVKKFKKDYYVSLDSERTAFNSECEFILTKANYILKIVRMENNTFYTSIRNKLMWGGAYKK